MWLIGIDDTDMPDTRGTGRLARTLACDLAERGLGSVGVTRHQLLIHPEVPYTSHNSAACLSVEGDITEPPDIFTWICDYVAERSPKGADPGVCMVRADEVTAAVREFGRRAQQEVLHLGEAREIGSGSAFLLAGLAGTRQGMIGAVAAVGLRAGGNDGRFIELGRIRQLGGKVQVRTLIGAGIDALNCPARDEPKGDEWVETFGWVRPRLCGGRAILFVERSIGNGVDWVVADRRSSGRCRSR